MPTLSCRLRAAAITLAAAALAAAPGRAAAAQTAVRGSSKPRVAPTTAQTSAPAPADVSTLVAHEIEAVEFAGGGAPLTPAERQQVANAVGVALRIDAPAWQAQHRAWTQAMQKAAKDPAATAVMREGTRTAFELARYTDRAYFSHPQFAPVNAMERPIVQAHDPAVVVDAAHGRVVTEQTLRALAVGAAWGAKAYQVPAPGPDLVDRLREALRTGYGALDSTTADGVAHAGRNLAYAPAFHQLAGAKKSAPLVASYHREFGIADPATQVKLAEHVSVIGAYGYRLFDQQLALLMTRRMVRSHQLMEQYVLGPQRMRNLRGMSPGCSVYNGQPNGAAYCSGH